LRQDEEGVYFSPPDDQGCLNSSTAFAVLALVEYFERKTMGRTFEGSPLFLYEMTEKHTGAPRDACVGIRDAFKTLRRYGVPPNEMRPYTDDRTKCESTDLSLLGFASDYASILYFRIDSGGCSGSDRLTALKSSLARGLPVVMGFSVPRSITQDSQILFRPSFDSYRGGQTVLAVGYDDARLPSGRGAVLVRNSWGTQWGESGYGWLPYSLISENQATNFWTTVSTTWSNAAG
jgi:C1A family cysteine protease